MMVNGPDGTPHEFPDDATNDEILGFFNKNAGAGGTPAAPVPAAGSAAAPSPAPNQPTIGSGIPNIPGSGMAPQSTAIPAPPSPSGPTIDPSHFTAMGSINDTLRSFNQGITGGMWNPAVGAARTALFGGQLGKNIAAEQQKSAEASQVSPYSNAAEEALGAIVGPGKLSRAGNAQSALARILGFGGESGLYSGVHALASGQDTLGPTATGFAAGTVLPAAIEGVGKVVSKMPGMGAPEPPTAAQVADPRKGGGYSFVSNADKQKAAVLDRLDTMTYNAQYGGKTIPTQIQSFLAKDSSGISEADQMGLNAEQKKVFEDATKQGSWLGKLMLAHPWAASNAIGHGVGVLGDVAALGEGVHGSPGMAAAIAPFSVVAHLSPYLAGQKLANAASQRAVENIARGITGTPTTGAAQDWLSNPNINRTLWNLIANRAADQQVNPQ